MPSKKKSLRTPAYKTEKGECVIPGAIPSEALSGFVVKTGGREAEDVRSYMEWQAPDEHVKHVEKVATESIYGQKMTAWDVRTSEGKWWVITNPTNLYSQKLFPSLDYTLSFHVGVTTRMSQAEITTAQEDKHGEVNFLADTIADIRLTYFNAEKVEDFQAVGMKCRECLLELVRKIREQITLPKDVEIPQSANFNGWCEIIANYVAAGASNDRIRGYLKSTSKAAWELVNWLTHTKSADGISAMVTVDATENIAMSFIMVSLRMGRKENP